MIPFRLEISASTLTLTLHVTITTNLPATLKLTYNPPTNPAHSMGGRERKTFTVSANGGMPPALCFTGRGVTGSLTGQQNAIITPSDYSHWQ